MPLASLAGVLVLVYCMQLIKQTGGDHREGLASGKIFRFSARKGNHGDLDDGIGDYYCLFSKLEVSCLLFL